jgi:hypothetical protein
MASHKLNLAGADSEICLTESGKAARDALDVRFGHAISDPEWALAGRSQPGSAFEKQRTARAALEACTGQSLNDLEGNRTRARLVVYASILSAWCGRKRANDAALS